MAPTRPVSLAGAVLYIVAFGYAIFYNYNVTKSGTLAISTGMVQQLAVLGAIFLLTDGHRGQPRSMKVRSLGTAISIY